MRAIEKHIRQRFESQLNADLLSNFQEGLWGITKDLIKKWNLENDTLEAQTQETKAFLTDLLL